MHTRTGRWWCSPAVWALAGSLVVPALAQAQLLPNLSTRKRHRVDCEHELPVFHAYRHEYYGYYPTCWRRFPPGWGCPSPEAPNWPSELIREPLQETPPASREGIEAAPPAEGENRTPRGAQRSPAIPPPPSDERSPFDLELPAPGAPPPLTPPGRTLEPPATAPRTSGGPRTGLAPEAGSAPPSTLEPTSDEGSVPALSPPGAAEAMPPPTFDSASTPAPPPAAEPLPTPAPNPAPEPIPPRLAPAAGAVPSAMSPSLPRRGPIMGWLSGRNRARR
jgi:hypothetical protein